MILKKGIHSTTLWHACHQPFLVLSSSPSKELEACMAREAKILESLTG